VHFSNKDVKHTFPDGKVVYYYSETRTTHTTQPDGLEMFEFSSMCLFVSFAVRAVSRCVHRRHAVDLAGI